VPTAPKWGPTARAPPAQIGYRKPPLWEFCPLGCGSAQRRRLATAPLRRATVAHGHRPSNGTLQPAFGRGDRARCSCTCTLPDSCQHIHTHTDRPVHVRGDVRCATALFHDSLRLVRVADWPLRRVLRCHIITHVARTRRLCCHKSSPAATNPFGDAPFCTACTGSVI
jgi:hypothetical protein